MGTFPLHTSLRGWESRNCPVVYPQLGQPKGKLPLGPSTKQWLSDQRGTRAKRNTGAKAWLVGSLRKRGQEHHFLQITHMYMTGCRPSITWNTTYPRFSNPGSEQGAVSRGLWSSKPSCQLYGGGGGLTRGHCQDQKTGFP